MVFIIKKKIKGKDYYYLRKSERKGGKVKSVNIAYLGKNKEEEEEKMRKIVSGEKSLNDTEKKERNMDNKKEKENGFGIDELAM